MSRHDHHGGRLAQNVIDKLREFPPSTGKLKRAAALHRERGHAGAFVNCSECLVAASPSKGDAR